MFGNHEYDKRIVSRIHEELLKLNKKKMATQLRKHKQRTYLFLMPKYILDILDHNLKMRHNLVV